MDGYNVYNAHSNTYITDIIAIYPAAPPTLRRIHSQNSYAYIGSSISYILYVSLNDPALKPSH